MKPSLLYGMTSLIFLLLTQVVSAQHDHGEINFKTSCSTEAQESFEYGLGMLHHMMYGQAVEMFEEATNADRDCAMAYWGVAMTKLNPLWAPPADRQFQKGLEAVEKAGNAGSPTEKEREFINALNVYYTTAMESDHQEGLKTWERALEEVYKKYPEDIDAGAFYGLSLLATASPEDDTYSHQRKAGSLLEELYKKAPEHPGLFHYIIHAYDNTELAEKGIEFAHGYDKLAPDVPHALHMPSHIFVRIGEWDETIEWNRRSADSALRQPVGDMTSMHHAHALDYMIYAYLQQGRDDKAQAVLEELNSVENYQPGVAAYNITAAQARYPLERRRWEDAAEIPLRVHSEFPWDDYPEFEAITYWARGLGAARNGDPEAAGEAASKLDELYEQTVRKGENYWRLLVDTQRKTVEAWILHEEGKHEEALALMLEAADQEDSVDKHPVTPSNVLPARELLGDLLLLHEKPEEAIIAYETALGISPNRFNSLFGAAIAAEIIGKTDVAEYYFSQLSEITVPEESERPELEQVAGFFERD